MSQQKELLQLRLANVGFAKQNAALQIQLLEAQYERATEEQAKVQAELMALEAEETKVSAISLEDDTRADTKE